MPLNPRLPMALVLFLLTAMSLATPAHAQVKAKPTNANGEVAFVVDFEVKPGSDEEFETYSKRSAVCARLDPGNVTFQVHKVVGAERRYLYYVVWRSPEALQSHLERPYTKALLGMFERSLAKPLSESIRYLGDLSPSARPAPVSGDPSDDQRCR